MAGLRVAAFQRYPLFDDVAGTVERLMTDLDWCDERGVQLALFPECYLQGYASDRPTIARRALSLDGGQVASILAQLARYRTAVVLGLIERRGERLYNSAVTIAGGAVVGTYAKCNPNERGFDAGSEYPVFETDGWPFGVNICYDANFPDAALRLSRQGAGLLCYPLNNMLRPATASKWRQKSIENLRHRAIETGCWVVSADVVGEHGGSISYGCTCIVRPDGAVMRQATEGVEQAILGDLSLTCDMSS